MAAVLAGAGSAPVPWRRRGSVRHRRLDQAGRSLCATAGVTWELETTRLDESVGCRGGVGKGRVWWGGVGGGRLVRVCTNVGGWAKWGFFLFQISFFSSFFLPHFFVLAREALM